MKIKDHWDANIKLWPLWAALAGAYSGHVLAQYRIGVLEKESQALELRLDDLRQWRSELKGRFDGRRNSRGRRTD